MPCPFAAPRHTPSDSLQPRAHTPHSYTVVQFNGRTAHGEALSVPWLAPNTLAQHSIFFLTYAPCSDKGCDKQSHYTVAL